jgi:hypothetical protein
MKNLIIKFLGLDKIQTQLEYVSVKHNQLQKEFNDTNWQDIAKESISARNIAEEVDMYELTDNLDSSDIASCVDVQELARYIDMEDLARELDINEVCENIDYGALQDKFTDSIDMDSLAQSVSEKIADRDGMHQLISEEIENQDVGAISTDAVQSMIDTAIQQFADSLEVMVSAKLNYDK